MLLNKSAKSAIIHRCLENHLPVSDWYPKVTPIFGDHQSYPGAELHETQIINFPLLIPDQQIKQICQIINEVLEEYDA